MKFHSKESSLEIHGLHVDVVVVKVGLAVALRASLTVVIFINV